VTPPRGQRARSFRYLHRRHRAPAHAGAPAAASVAGKAEIGETKSASPGISAGRPFVTIRPIAAHRRNWRLACVRHVLLGEKDRQRPRRQLLGKSGDMSARLCAQVQATLIQSKSGARVIFPCPPTASALAPLSDSAS